MTDGQTAAHSDEPVTIVGAGRAGQSFASALTTAGRRVTGLLTRRDLLYTIAESPGVVLLCVDDASVREVSAAIAPGQAVVAHVAGSLPVDAICDHHQRRAAIHPLMALPDAEVGARRLLDNGWFAVSGDEAAAHIATSLGGRTMRVNDADRVTYHAAAVVASNHVTALLGQVERLAESIGLPLEPFLDLCRGAVDSVDELGAHAALTGPAARGDRETLERHLTALTADERDTYRAVMVEAQRLAGQGARDQGVQNQGEPEETT